MKNFNYCLEIDKVNSQLERADIQKNRIIINIYKEYELYLNLVRDLLYISVEKGFNELYSDTSIKSVFLNPKELICFFEKKISRVISSKLPLITIEQLKINKTEKNVVKEFNFNSMLSSLNTKDDPQENFQYEGGFQFEKPIDFEISEDISNASEYYQAENHKEFFSLDLDKNENINKLSNNHIFENIGLEKQFLSS